MSLNEQQASEEPYSWEWDLSAPVPQEAERVFQEVARSIEINQTEVVWKKSVECLGHINKHLETHEEARQFMERYMRRVISILVRSGPAKLGLTERHCVEGSLELATMIIAKDIRIQLERNGKCVVLDILSPIFNWTKFPSKGSSKGSHPSHVSGLSAVRMRLIDRFLTERGFFSLAEYLSKRVNNSQFPDLDVVHQIISCLCDSLPIPPADRNAGAKELEDDALLVTQATMDFLLNCSDDCIENLSVETLNHVIEDLRELFDRLVVTRRKETHAFYEFWRVLTVRLITSPSFSVKLFGWDQANLLLENSIQHRPPARSFTVSGAGLSFVNGLYSFAGATTEDGYAVFGTDVRYQRSIPQSDKDAGGKKLALSQRTMHSQQKWWFLSEFDEDQPGVDYYQCWQDGEGQQEPPPDHWIACKSSGLDPPPKLHGEGVMVPLGEEYETLEYQFAKWAIDYGIVELALEDLRPDDTSLNKYLQHALFDTLHREIVVRAIPIIKFLAFLSTRDVSADGFEGSMRLAECSLEDSHLTLAWETYSKAGTAVSKEVCQMLVSILPSLSNEIVGILLTEVRTSLFGYGAHNFHYLEKVADFCMALIGAEPTDMKPGQSVGLNGFSDEMRDEIIDLMWALLSSQSASSLKNYDHLKRYLEGKPETESQEKSTLESQGKSTATETDLSKEPVKDLVWYELYIGDETDGEVDFVELGENRFVGVFRDQIKRKCEVFLRDVDARNLSVYAPCTKMPISDGIKPLDPRSTVPNEDHPFVVVAPAPNANQSRQQDTEEWRAAIMEEMRKIQEAQSRVSQLLDEKSPSSES